MCSSAADDHATFWLIGSLKHAQIEGFMNLGAWWRNANPPHYWAETSGKSMLHVLDRYPHVRHVDAASIVKVDSVGQPTFNRLVFPIDSLPQPLIHVLGEPFPSEVCNDHRSHVLCSFASLSTESTQNVIVLVVNTRRKPYILPMGPGAAEMAVGLSKFMSLSQVQGGLQGYFTSNTRTVGRHAPTATRIEPVTLSARP